jgi:predicted transcriptional regulator
MKQMLPRIENWSSEDQEALFEAAKSIEAERKGVYRATESEPAAIDRGLSEAQSGRFADTEAVEKVRAKFRNE